MGRPKHGPTAKTRGLIGEWVKYTGSTQDFCAEKSLNINTFQTLLSKHGAYDLRRSVMAGAAERTKEKMEDELTDFFTDMTRGQVELWSQVKNKAKELLATGEIGPSQLDRLTSSIERMLKAYRLMEGKSTENVEQKNLHLAAVEIIENVKSGKPPQP